MAVCNFQKQFYPHVMGTQSFRNYHHRDPLLLCLMRSQQQCEQKGIFFTKSNEVSTEICLQALNCNQLVVHLVTTI